MILKDVDRAVKAIKRAQLVSSAQPDTGLQCALEIVTKVQEKLHGKAKRMGQRGRRKA